MQFRSGFFAFYFIWVATFGVIYFFDPFNMRQERLIQLAQMKARGKDTSIDLATLLDAAKKSKAPEEEDSAIRKTWEVQVRSRASNKNKKTGTDDCVSAAAAAAAAEAAASATTSGRDRDRDRDRDSSSSSPPSTYRVAYMSPGSRKYK